MVKAILQRVTYGSVEVNGSLCGQIDRGLVVLLGVARDDTEKDAAMLAEKLVHLRIFEDGDGKMNLSLLEVGGAVLAISQFTLLANCRKGRRPNYIDAAPPELAEPLYESFARYLRTLGAPVETGLFQAKMKVAIHNDGPVTILLDSRQSRRQKP